MFCNQTLNSTDCYDQAENGFSVVYVYYQEMTALIHTEYSAYGVFKFCITYNKIPYLFKYTDL